MKKVILAIALVIGMTSPSFAWYDGYGYYHCTYLDPLTSFFDGIFGQPCPPPPVAVVQAPPVVIEKQVPVYVDRPVPVAVPQPVPVPVGPCPTYGYWCW